MIKILKYLLDLIFGTDSLRPEPRENSSGEKVITPPPLEEIVVPPPKVPDFPNISDHKIESVEYIPDPDMGEYLDPKMIVLHHTVSYTMKGTVDWFSDKSVDVHLLVDRDSSTVQMVPFNRKAAHAGTSSFSGYIGLNNYAIGIEAINVGYLTKKGDKFFDYYGREYTGEVRYRKGLGFEYWEPFTSVQEERIIALCVAICRKYRIPADMVRGHFEVSPGRKNDPYGGFSVSMDDLRKIIASHL